MIKVLIVDKSKTEAELLKHVISSELDMEVIAWAKNSKEAIALASLLKPNLITMDISIPFQDCFESIRTIMMKAPTPIVAISSTVNDPKLNTTFLALEAGALSVIGKPVNVQDSTFETARKEIVSHLRSMADVKVVTIRPKKTLKLDNEILTEKNYCKNYDLVAIGSSVGGPQALKVILSSLPNDFPVPIVIVQHMTIGFIDGFCKWLNSHCSINVKCVENNEQLKAGNVYLAPDNYHFKIARSHTELVAHLQKSEAVSGFCPSINVMFHSIARTCANNTIAMLLTGMGSDGSQGLLEIKLNKGHTIIQNPESCVVFGMAGVAQSLGGVDSVVELDKISEYLVRMVKQPQGNPSAIVSTGSSPLGEVPFAQQKGKGLF